MTDMLPLPRRVVTGFTADGRSTIVEDGAPVSVKTIEARPGYRNSNIWRTEGSPAPIAAPDGTRAQTGVLPPKGGTIIRVIDYPPEEKDPERRRRQQEATFKAMYADAKHEPGHGRHAGMHLTETVDYAIVLQGEIVALMEEGETILRAGDILIQRGTNHAWANRSDAMARICFVLVDGRFD